MSVVQTQSSSNPKNESVDASAPLLPSSSSSALSPSRDIFPTSHQPETIENPTTTTTAVNKSSQPLKMSLTIAVAPHPSPPVVVATNIPQWQQALDSPDKLLSTIGPRNGFVLFIWIAMALVWGIGALPTMVSAFLMDDICRKNNGTGDGQEAGRNCTPQKGTVTEEFHLDEAHVFLVDLTTSAYIAGMSLGNICLPFVADRNGRRPALLASMFFSGVVGLASALSPNIFAFITMRFVQGIFFSGCILINWNLAYECIPLSLRSQTAVVFGLFWVLGYCLVAPMALLLSGWRPLIATTSAPSILFAIFYFFTIPESFHFLASKRKVAAIRGWIRRANKSAERSGTRKIEPNELNAFLEKLEEKRSSVVESVESMASKRSQKQWKESFGTLLLYLLVSVFLWTVDSFTYYGLSLFSTQLAGNRYVNFMLVALVEVPSYVFAPFFLDRLGRRLTTAFMHLLAAAAFFLAAAISNHPQLYLLLWLLAKYSISTSFTGLFVYGSEYFPTAKRNICMGICATVSQAFSIFTPTVIRLVANLSPVAPMLFYGIASLLACALTFLLPETRGKELPERTE